MRRMGSTGLSQVDEVLLACLEQVEAGRATPGECLARYPELRAELEPLLSVALSLRGLSLEVTPTPAFKSQARARLMAEMACLPDRQARDGSPWRVTRLWFDRVVSRPFLELVERTGVPKGLSLPKTRMATAAASVVLALALASAGTVSAAQQALPGDALYPVKTASEQARLALAPSDEARGDLLLQFAEARLKEMDQSIDKGRVEATSWLAQEYQRHLAQAQVLAERDTDGTLRAKVGAAGDRHQTVLKAVYERVPDAAKEAIAIALAASAPSTSPGQGPSTSSGQGPSPTATPQPKPTEAPDADPAAAGQPSGPKGVSSPTSVPDKNTPTPTPDPVKSTPTPQPKPAAPAEGAAPAAAEQPPAETEKPSAVSTPTGDTDPSKVQSTPSPTPTPGEEGSRKGQGARP